MTQTIESKTERETRRARTELHLTEEMLNTGKTSRAREFLTKAYGRIISGHASPHLKVDADRLAKRLI